MWMRTLEIQDMSTYLLAIRYFIKKVIELCFYVIKLLELSNEAYKLQMDNQSVCSKENECK